MNPPPSSQTPARVRWRWRWGRIVLLGLVAGIGALGWNQYTWQRAVRQLEEAGITLQSQGEHLGERLWRTAKADWRQLFKAGTWQTPRILWRMDSEKAGPLRNLDALAPALRRVDPEVLVVYDWIQLTGCPALQNVDALNGLTALQALDLRGCTALQNVDGLKGLTALQALNLSGCASLQNVDGIKGLTALQVLHLSGCAALQNVDGIKGLTTLHVLGLRGCWNLPPEQVAALRAALPTTDILYP